MINQTPTILHAIDTTGPGGAETVFLDLAQHLTVEGFNNFAVIKGPGWVEDQLEARGIPYAIIKPSGFLSIRYYWELSRLLKRMNVKLIQAHLLGSTLTYSVLSILMRIPLVATLHGQVDINPKERNVYLKNRIMRWGVNRLVAVSESLANYIADRGLFKRHQIDVIYNGIDTRRYGKRSNHDIRQQLDIDEKAMLIGCVGNVRPAKAYHVLIDAAAIVLARYPGVHFVVAGHQKPILMKELQDQLERKGLQEHFHFIGFHPDTAEFLGQMDLFALSSISEGFSIATIEAMASGLPVVATRCGGPEEILHGEQAGLLVETHSSQALAEALIKLIENPVVCQQLAAQGKADVEEKFSLTSLKTQYQRIYKNLLYRSKEISRA